jgi:hypothetical protein
MTSNEKFITIDDRKEELIGKIAILIKGFTDDEIDEVVAEAKEQVNSEILAEKKDKLTELFKSQLEKLKSLGCPQMILEIFSNKKNEVITKASEMSIGEGNIPFLPVIPRNYLGIHASILMVKYGDKAGYTNLNPNEITDKVKTPKLPYFVLNVEDGKATLGKKVKDATKLIKKQGRLILTDIEVIAIGILTNVLSHHNVDAAGSRYRSNNCPDLHKHGGVPVLGYDGLDTSDGQWGSASCSARV